MTTSPFSVPLFGDAAVDLTVVLLMLVFGIAIGVGLACLFIVLHTVRRRPPGSRMLLRLAERPVRLEPRAFAGGAPWPHRWLAIQGGDLGLVQRTLGLHQVSPCSWEEGISAAHHQLLFLTPPIQGWILVFGSALPDPVIDVDSCYLSLARLSRKLSRIQYFSVNHALGHHAWAMLDDGRVLRAYAWAGKTLWNQGPLTTSERDIGLICYDYGEGETSNPRFRSTETLMNTQRVQALAGRWSLDPATVEARLGRDGLGFAGHLSRSRTV